MVETQGTRRMGIGAVATYAIAPPVRKDITQVSKVKSASLKAAEKATGLKLPSTAVWPAIIPAPYDTVEICSVLLAEMVARASWYDSCKETGGIPRRPFSTVQRSLLNTLERSKVKLVMVVDAVNFKDAARKLAYTVQYAPRVRLS